MLFVTIIGLLGLIEAICFWDIPFAPPFDILNNYVDFYILWLIFCFGWGRELIFGKWDEPPELQPNAKVIFLIAFGSSAVFGLFLSIALVRTGLSCGYIIAPLNTLLVIWAYKSIFTHIK